jgi:hypothetical protein
MNADLISRGGWLVAASSRGRLADRFMRRWPNRLSHYGPTRRTRWLSVSPI